MVIFHGYFSHNQMVVLTCIYLYDCFNHVVSSNPIELVICPRCFFLDDSTLFVSPQGS